MNQLGSYMPVAVLVIAEILEAVQLAAMVVAATLETLLHQVQKIQAAVAVQEKPAQEMAVPVSLSSASIRRRQHEIRNRN